MKRNRIILIACVIIITLFILYKLIDKRIDLYQQLKTHISKYGDSNMIFNSYEPFDADSEYDQVTALFDNSFNIVSATNTNLPMKYYCMKASFNSASSGSYVNTRMLEFVLSRGCRYLDLEINLDSSDPTNPKPVVSFPKCMNSILLKDALATIANNAFRYSYSKDPLFLNLRINPSSFNKFNVVMSVYSFVSNVVQNTLGKYLFSGSVTGDTILDTLKGKIVLSIDKRSSSDYLNQAYYTWCDISLNRTNQTSQTSQFQSLGATLNTPQSIATLSPQIINMQCANLSNFINIESYSNVLEVFREKEFKDMKPTPPNVSNSEILNVNNWKMVYPEFMDGFYNTSSFPCITNFGAQIIMNKFYKYDTNIIDYEALFANYSTAFVPLSSAIDYIQKHKKPSIDVNQRMANMNNKLDSYKSTR